MQFVHVSINFIDYYTLSWQYRACNTPLVLKSLCAVAFGLSSTICYIRILHLSNLWDIFILYILAFINALKYLGIHREWYQVPLDLHILVIPKMVKVKILHLLNYITWHAWHVCVTIIIFRIFFKYSLPKTKGMFILDLW